VLLQCRALRVCNQLPDTAEVAATQNRVRTRRLRRYPRYTLYVHATSPAWRGLETTLTLLDGPDAPELNLRLFRVMQGRPAGSLWWYGHELDETAFVDQMRAEQRLVYELEVERSYGPRPRLLEMSFQLASREALQGPDEISRASLARSASPSIGGACPDRDGRPIVEIAAGGLPGSGGWGDGRGGGA
jgi:hypothetical protein